MVTHQWNCQREIERQADDSSKYLAVKCTCGAVTPKTCGLCGAFIKPGDRGTCGRCGAEWKNV